MQAVILLKLLMMLLCAPLPGYSCSFEVLAYEDESVETLADVLVIAADDRASLVIARGRH